jgi:hypothetical protein
MFGMSTAFLLFIGNRLEEQLLYVVFLVGATAVIIYVYYAAFVVLFRALLLVEEKGDIKASKRYVESVILLISAGLNVYYASVVASG